MSKSGEKHDQEKARWDLLPLEPIKEAVVVLTKGAKEYSPNGWQKVENGVERYYAALWRHIYDWRSGKVIDPESGCRNLAHALCCLIFIMWLTRKKGSNVKT